MSHAAIIVDALGGTVAVATELELTPSTVSSWKTSGRIPRWRQPSIDALAARKGVDLASVALCTACDAKAAGEIAACTSVDCPNRLEQAA